MSKAELLILAADFLLVIHVLFVTFVVMGLVLIFIGKFAHWSWVRNRWFRITHLIAIMVVVVQSWFGVLCPLTTWEMSLRAKAGETVYAGSFVQYWLHAILYYDAPAWVFIACYTAFAMLVVLSWFAVRPAKGRH